MTLTKEDLKRRYDEYNQAYFYGRLGKCDFMFFSRNVGFLGWYNNRDDKKGRPKDRIWMGTCICWTEEVLQKVLIHEMIHMYNVRVEKKWWRGILSHGPCFRRHCRRIKRDFDIDVLDLPALQYRSTKVKPPKRWEKILTWIIDR